MTGTRRPETEVDRKDEVEGPLTHEAGPDRAAPPGSPRGAWPFCPCERVAFCAPYAGLLLFPGPLLLWGWIRDVEKWRGRGQCTQRKVSRQGRHVQVWRAWEEEEQAPNWTCCWVLAGTWVPDEGPALHTALGSSRFRVRVMFCGVSESDSEL